MIFAGAITAGAHIYYCERFFDCVSLLRNFAQNDKRVVSRYLRDLVRSP